MHETANFEIESKFVVIIPKLAINTSWIFSRISYVFYYACIIMLQYEQHCLVHECSIKARIIYHIECSIRKYWNIFDSYSVL